jgi:hypothetical protein
MKNRSNDVGQELRRQKAQVRDRDRRLTINYIFI